MRRPGLSEVYMAGQTVLLAISTAPVAPPGAGTFQTVVGWVAWAVTVCAAIGLLGVAGSLMLQHQRGGISEHGARFGQVVTGIVLAVFAGPIVTALGLAG